jgi:hypothetical protein
MAVITANFETGTNGSTISTSDTGSATAFNLAFGSVSYSNAQAAHGSLSGKINPSSQEAYVGWGANFGTQTDHYGRMYVYIASYPGSTEELITWGTTTSKGDGAGSIWITSAGKLQGVTASLGSATSVFTNAIPLNQWARVEWHAVHNASTGSLSISLFNSAESATATETQSGSSLNMAASAASAAFGMARNNVTATLYLDNIVENGTAAIGAFPTFSACTVSGNTDVGSTLTASTTLNGTFNLSYQWTSDGSNIVGATSSTYVTQSGDSGHAIGCTVTATGQQATSESASQASSNTVTVTSGGATSGSASGGVNMPTSFLINN